MQTKNEVIVLNFSSLFRTGFRSKKRIENAGAISILSIIYASKLLLAAQSVDSNDAAAERIMISPTLTTPLEES